MSGKIIGGKSFHPIIEACNGNAALAAAILPELDQQLLDPTGITGTEIDFGSGSGDYPYLPRGFEVLVDGDLNYRIGGLLPGLAAQDRTVTFTAGTTVTGIITRITKSGSTTTSIRLIY